MPRRQPVIQLPAVPPDLGHALALTVMAAWTGYRIRAAEWPSAAIDAAAVLLVLYVIFRRARKPKGTRMALLSKEQIFAADDRKWEDVPVPEWGGEVRILGLDGTGRDAYESSIQKVVNGKVVRDDRNFRARLVALCAVYEDGRLMFDQNEVAALARRSSAALSRLFDKACELSGITEDDQAALTENFDDAPAGPSTSVSPPTSAAPPSPPSWPVSAPTN
jgi:hypothetical protein